MNIIGHTINSLVSQTIYPGSYTLVFLLTTVCLSLVTKISLAQDKFIEFHRKTEHSSLGSFKKISTRTQTLTSSSNTVQPAWEITQFPEGSRKYVKLTKDVYRNRTKLCDEKTIEALFTLQQSLLQTRNSPLGDDKRNDSRTGPIDDFQDDFTDLVNIIDKNCTFPDVRIDEFNDGFTNKEVCRGGTLVDVIQEVKENTLCFFRFDILECLAKEEDGMIPPPYMMVMCNYSTQISSILEVSNSTHRNKSREMLIMNQEQFYCIQSNDFESYPHLQILTISNTSLCFISPGAFGKLNHLTSLDLRFNKLVTLSWRILVPSIFNRTFAWRHIYSIRLAGNPFNPSCETKWVFEDGSDSFADGIWMIKTDLHPTSNLQQELNMSMQFALNLGVNYSISSPVDTEIFNEITLDRSMADNLDSKTYYIDENTDCKCLPTGSNVSIAECYLRLPYLEIVRHDENSIFLKCSVEGVPSPQIRWQLDNPSVSFSTIGSFTVANESSTLIKVNWHHSQPQPQQLMKHNNHGGATSKIQDFSSHSLEQKHHIAKCIGTNDRGFTDKDICVSQTFNIKITVANKFPVKILFEMQSSSPLVPDVHMWKWSFSPCSISSKIRKTLSLYKSENKLKGMLHYPETRVNVMLPGWYKVSVPTLCKVVEKTVLYFDGASHMNPTEQCRLINPFQSLKVKINVFKGLQSDNGVTEPGQHSTNTSSHSFPTTAQLDITPPSTEETDSFSMLISGIMVGSVLSLIFLWLMVVLTMRRWKKGKWPFKAVPNQNQDSPFILNFLDDLPCTAGRENDAGFYCNEMHTLNAGRLVENPYYASDEEFEASNFAKVQPTIIPLEKLKFISEIGEGAFGRVFLGQMEKDGTTIKVAVKSLKNISPHLQGDMEREVEMLSSVDHEKIIKLYGICQDKETILMVFEYMEFGDLNNYLRLHNEDIRLDWDQGQDREPLSVMDCLQAALQIASGMSYLASQHYVHRDLATRNCLVTANLVVKIGDFGMSRDVYTSDYYQIGGQALLPVRWMSPESILYLRFTIKSDIWSFGVVLWEIFTGGRQPWYGYTNQEVISRVTDGEILPCPEMCLPDLYDLMVSCWAKQPKDRIPMVELEQKIKNLTTLHPGLTGLASSD